MMSSYQFAKLNNVLVVFCEIIALSKFKTVAAMRIFKGEITCFGEISDPWYSER